MSAVVDASVLVAAAVDTGPEGVWAERIVADSPLAIDEGAVSLTVSIGVAQLGDTDTSVSDWIARADRALYEAKASGRNTVRCWRVGAR